MLKLKKMTRTMMMMMTKKDSEDDLKKRMLADMQEKDSDDEDDDEDAEAEEDDEDDDDECIQDSGEEPGFDSGCTACLALVKGNELFVANVGDSRCVVSRRGEAVDMSFD